MPLERGRDTGIETSGRACNRPALHRLTRWVEDREEPWACGSKALPGTGRQSGQGSSQQPAAEENPEREKKKKDGFGSESTVRYVG
jgi:hypothetical protein